MNAVDMNQSALGIAADLVKAVTSPPEITDTPEEASASPPDTQKP